MPPLATAGLRKCQVEAIEGLEHSLAENRPRSLIQMATGSGKTFTAVSAIYRLIKYGGAQRVLFLVDRANLGRQTLKEFQQYATPDDGRKFTELYNVQHLAANRIDPVARVVHLHHPAPLLDAQGERSSTRALEEASLFDEIAAIGESRCRSPTTRRSRSRPSTSIFIDECHRSIYNLWRQVLEYFDAFLIGLTATPSKQTFGFFNQNLVMEYGHEQAVADGVNVDYDVYRIRTEITEGRLRRSRRDSYVDYRDRPTRRGALGAARRGPGLHRAATSTGRGRAEDQIRTVIRDLQGQALHRDLPRTHRGAEDADLRQGRLPRRDIVRDRARGVRQGQRVLPEDHLQRLQAEAGDLLAEFRNSYNPRIVVTVDMIATGTDIKPLEIVIFMRDVKSQNYYEQMVGRGTRTISETDLQAVTGDAQRKTHFVLIDAIGVTETAKGTDVRPLERRPTVAFDNLLSMVAFGTRDPDTLTTLASRLSSLDRQLDESDRQTIREASAVRTRPTSPTPCSTPWTRTR